MRASYESISQFLKSRSAAIQAHVQGSLLEHLQGTHERLLAWGNPPAVCNAGLCHAVYSTDGYAVQLLDVHSERETLRDTIGAEAEALTYFYASCDRGFLYPRIRRGDPLAFRDRFTGATFAPEPDVFSRFMELTFANELDIFAEDAQLVERHGAPFRTLFAPCQRYVSAAAYETFRAVFGPAARSVP